jgi:hypothetical protein
MTLFMISNKKVNSIFILIFICTSGFGQNHRQFANWICGDFSINKKVNEVDVKIASSHIVNLSNVDSSNYWVVEDMNIDKVKKQRILHLHLLDSGYVGLDIYELKNNKPIATISTVKQIKLENYQKANQMQIVFYYNRKSRGFELQKDPNQLFYMDKFMLILNCCNDFSKFYYDKSKEQISLYLYKKID